MSLKETAIECYTDDIESKRIEVERQISEDMTKRAQLTEDAISILETMIFKKREITSFEMIPSSLEEHTTSSSIYLLINKELEIKVIRRSSRTPEKPQDSVALFVLHKDQYFVFDSLLKLGEILCK